MRDFQSPNRSAAFGANGAAATSHPQATITALDVLRSGGNAVDAAIAACAVQCVVEPQMTGIGGDCFAFVAEPDGTVSTLNGSGRTGAASTLGWFQEQGILGLPSESVHAVTVPGALRGWEALLSRFGTKGLDALLAPAIRHAEVGYVVTPRVASDWANNVSRLAAHPATAHFYLKDGQAPAAGDTMRLPEMAGVLRAIAKDGADAFYTGWIANDLVETLSHLGSRLTADDFTAANADWVMPLQRTYQGHDVFGFPPNTQGFAALQILGQTEPTDQALDDPLHPDRAHVYAEAVRRAYAMRNTHLADPDAMAVAPEALVSDETIAALRASIQMDRATPVADPLDLKGSNTVYLGVVDRDGMAVSFINSLFSNFGSAIAGEKTGILLHNRGSGFSLAEGHPNAIAPRKRPAHTLVPGMVLKDGLPALSYGVMGGAYQAAGHGWFLANALAFGMDVQAALELPRLFVANDKAPGGFDLVAETTLPDSVVADLERRGHRITRATTPHGCGQAIRIDRARGVFIAGSDPRKDSLALAY
ncbi:MAG: gamma-glutamyltransferase family protein [Pseudomonadota bacterium]